MAVIDRARFDNKKPELTPFNDIGAHRFGRILKIHVVRHFGRRLREQTTQKERISPMKIQAEVDLEPK